MKFIKLTRPLVHPYSQIELFHEDDVLTFHALRVWCALTGCDYATGEVHANKPDDSDIIKGDTVMRVVATHDNLLHIYNL